MKKITLLLIILLSSCATVKQGTIIPFKKQYNIKNSQVFESSYDKIWEYIIDFFAENNISIAQLEKASGFISSPNTIFTTTVEDNDGNLINKNAWVVVTRLSTFKKDGTGLRASACWNIRVKKRDGGKLTEVKVNIGTLTPEAYLVNSYDVYGVARGYSYARYGGVGYSTGVFENLLLNYINNQLK